MRERDPRFVLWLDADLLCRSYINLLRCDMARKLRQSIPEDLAAEALFLSDRTCCVCRTPGKPVQIHHVDENPSNNTLENLAALCFDCHRDTQIRGGFDRKLDARQVILYRDDWHRIVAQRRGSGSEATIIDNRVSSSMLHVDSASRHNTKVIIGLDIEYVNEVHKRWLQNGLATFLGISPNDIQIVSVQKGSWQVTVLMPGESAMRLIAAYERKDPELTKSLAPLVILRIDKLEYNESVAKKFQLGEAWSALEQLHSLGAGRKHYVVYQRNVYDVLRVVLNPHLTNPRLQASTISDSRRGDILFSNYSSHPFWQRMSQRHDATQIVFEVKNVRRLEMRDVGQLASYLTPGLGHLGFLISRGPAGEAVLRYAVNVFRAAREVILFLCDNDLEEMLKLKEKGGEPTELIRKRYDDFVTLV
jgi:hypothetical protein